MTEPSHPRGRLDENLQTSLRLSLLAALVEQQEVEFMVLRDALDATDSTLSKAISQLTVAGYVLADRRQVGSRQRLFVRSTHKGRAALRKHVAALRAIVDLGPEVPPDDAP